MGQITVVNLKQYKGEGIYIGRGSVFGNPFVIGRDGDREQVIAKYRRQLFEALKTSNALGMAVRDLSKKKCDIVLKCYCAPKACHGDVIRAAILWLRS